MQRIIFTASLLVFFNTAFSQTKKQVLNDSTIYPMLPLLIKERIIGKSAYGTVYALPQDNMPVVAADTSLLKQIPNGFYGPMMRTMPNAINPNRKFKTFDIPDSLKGKLFVIPKNMYKTLKKD